MSDYDLLPEVDLRPQVEQATAHNAKGGRKAVRKLMASIADNNRRRPKWKSQLRCHMATKARVARLERERADA